MFLGSKSVRKLARLFGIVPRVISGPGIGLRFDANAAPEDCLTGEYERPIQDLMCRLLAEGKVVYDIGANVGYFSILSARLVGPTGMIYSFEPVPANGAAIQRNAGLNGFTNISVLNVAISNEIGERELFLAEHVGGSVLKSVAVPPDLIGSMQVNTVTIDSLVERENLLLPDVVKIDVEGAELNVLKGMRSVLEQKRPDVILEFDDAVEAICDDKYDTCERYLADLNYTCASLPDSYANQGWYVRHMLAQPKAA